MILGVSAPPEIFAELDRDASLSAYAGSARKLKALLDDLPVFRAAILSNHTFDIGVTLTVECARRGLQVKPWFAGYDQYRQELLDPESAMHAFQPDAVLLSLDFEGEVDWVAELKALIAAYRGRSATPVFLQNRIPPDAHMDGILTCSQEQSLLDRVMQLNAALRAMAASLDSVYILDAAEIACRSGLAGWRDRRLWHLARAGINPKKFPLLAAHIARAFAALRRPAAKCLVADLDNTLWGGILGEQGPEGVICAGADYPGSAYADFHRALLALHGRGILLAVASKNDSALVEELFRQRADMLIRPEHVSGWEVNWGPKPESIRRIAGRLNIGLDSIVFLDDNPAEIDLMKMALPAVRSYLLPAKPEDFVHFLASLEDFDQLRISAEDARRAELYQLRRKQTEMASAATDLESFYRSLETVLIPEEAGSANLDRIVQLFQKTNQFNLTTRRYQKAELLERLNRGSELWAFRARDVHGDHGIIAVALLDIGPDTAAVDSLLMSCRVIGRTIETAVLHFLEQRALDRRADALQGEYIETARNTPCRDFFEAHGYECVAASDSVSVWQKDLRRSPTQRPEWIRLEQPLATCSAS